MIATQNEMFFRLDIIATFPFLSELVVGTLDVVTQGLHHEAAAAAS
jgi:hypothetical protein